MKNTEFTPEFLEALRALDEAWPYKRVRAPQHVLDAINEADEKRKTLEFAITVDKNVEVTDQTFIDAFNYLKENKGEPVTFGDSNRPPETGLEKRKL